MANSLGDTSAASSANVSSCPLLTADIPGIGGRIKESPDDFVVEELAAYEPSGAGEHLFLWIEKRDTSAEQLTQHLSRTLGVSPRDVGTAGLKDRRAVTRQWVSVPGTFEERIGDVESENIRVLRSARHGNKLRTGHSRGNRFRIVVAGVAANAAEHAGQVCRAIAERGFPNYFGDQRFGINDETLKLGLDLLTGRKQQRDIPASRRRFLFRLALSAAQSQLFNRALAQRLTDGLLAQVLAGDVMQVIASGGPFVVEDPAREQARFDAGETAITGPIFGPKMRQPAGIPAERERRVLDECGLTADNFLRHRKLTPGARRPYLVRPGDLAVFPGETSVRLEFTLPSGVYATSLLREFQEGG